MAQKDMMDDARLTKNAGASVRGDRTDSDNDRTQNNGIVTDAERRRMLREDWVQEILPKPPEMEGFHTCWLSTTNSADPIFKRVQRGYTPVKTSEVPGFGNFKAAEGDYAGCVTCNEMLLFKIPMQLYQDLMAIYHHDMPQENEQAIYERVQQVAESEKDNSGRQLGQVEGDGFQNMARGSSRRPTFL